MNTKTETKEEVNFENEIFNVDFEKEKNEADDSFMKNILSDSLESENKTETIETIEKNEADDFNEENENDSDELNFNEENENDSDELKLDLKSFNKKLGKNFETEKELLEFINSKDDKKEISINEETIEKADNEINYYSPLLELNDKDLMYKQFEAIAIQNGKDINNENVKIELEDQVQEIIDSYELSVKSGSLRKDIQKIVDKAEETKKEIINKAKEKEDLLVKERKSKLQDSFASIHSKKVFFGVDTDAKKVSSIYKKVSTGKFIEELQSDPEKLAEAAMLMEMKEEIHKKSSGLSYSDGIKAVLDDYKKSETKDTAVRAQNKGSQGSSSNQNGLISDVLS